LCLDDDTMWIETCRKARRYNINMNGRTLCSLLGEYCELVATAHAGKNMKSFLIHHKKTWWLGGGGGGSP